MRMKGGRAFRRRGRCGIPLRHRLPPDMGGFRRRGRVRYRGRHRLPRALFCQAPFSAPGPPGLPSGGRGDAGRRDVLARLSAAAVQVPRPRVLPRRGGIPLRHRLPPDMGGLRRRESVRYRGRHWLPRALFCQAPFNAPGAPGRPSGGGSRGPRRRDVLARLSAAVVQVPRPRVRGSLQHERRRHQRAGSAPACPGQTGGRGTRARERSGPP